LCWGRSQPVAHERGVARHGAGGRGPLPP
jgi:hypothetical protein